MKLRAVLGGAVGLAIVAGGAGWYWSDHGQAGSAPVRESTALATPPGIILQVFGNPSFVGATQEFVNPPGRNFADAKGMPLYTYDRDEPGKSNCAGKCAELWSPSLADAAVRTFGDWSLVSRDDGARQWAYRGRPLYTYAKDGEVETVPVHEDPRFCAIHSCSIHGLQTKGNGVEGAWHIALLDLPAAGIGLPDGIEVREVAEAEGQVLVDDRGFTLYAFNGKATDDRAVCAGGKCKERWIPAEAPALGNPVGDFSIADRGDGKQQWVYRGRALFRYDGDLEAGDVTGIGVDPKWHVAQLVRYFMPPSVNIVQTRGKGKVLSVEGMTLYRRDGYRYEVGGHGIAHTGRFGTPSTGRDIGTKTCDAECVKTWRPFVAATDAKPSGFWDILIRDDGTRQWAYKGYALYTYAGDKNPGDMLGNDTYDFLVHSNIYKSVDAPAALIRKLQGAGAVFWGIAPP